VEEILDKKIEDGITYWLIKWKGFGGLLALSPSAFMHITSLTISVFNLLIQQTPGNPLIIWTTVVYYLMFLSHDMRNDARDNQSGRQSRITPKILPLYHQSSVPTPCGVGCAFPTSKGIR